MQITHKNNGLIEKQMDVGKATYRILHLVYISQQNALLWTKLEKHLISQNASSVLNFFELQSSKCLRHFNSNSNLSVWCGQFKITLTWRDRKEDLQKEKHNHLIGNWHIFNKTLCIKYMHKMHICIKLSYSSQKPLEAFGLCIITGKWLTTDDLKSDCNYFEI